MRLASGEFAYVTITDTKPLRDGMARRYDEFIPVARRFGEQLPLPLLGQPVSEPYTGFPPEAFTTEL